MSPIQPPHGRAPNEPEPNSLGKDHISSSNALIIPDFKSVKESARAVSVAQQPPQHPRQEAALYGAHP